MRTGRGASFAGTPLVLVLACVVVVTMAQCPPFDESRVPRCDSRTDHALCVLAAHKDSDRLADFEFINIPEGLKDADPLACKIRMAAIRQHILYYGSRGLGSTNCHRAAAVFKTYSLSPARVSDVCEQVGFPKCGTCRHGGRMEEKSDGSCQCHCRDGWAGKDCSECGLSVSECLHQGNITRSATECGCVCAYPWTGTHCEQCGRRCNHDGFVDPTDARCSCQCAFPWTGPECNDCSLQCQHSGKLVHTDKECRCECPVLASGPQCEQCSARCLNGGILDKDTCSCKCVGGFTGAQCEICDVSCQYNGTFIPNECRCTCTNPWTSGAQCETCSNTCHNRGREVQCSCIDCEGYWSGPSCANCTLRCTNEGELDHQSCKCSCDRSRCKHGKFTDDCSCLCEGSWRGEMCDQCHLNCRHGTLVPEQCMCKCDSFFSGVRCEKCEHNCTGRGLLDPHTCVCSRCVAPYYGYDCAQECTKKCQHGSVLNAATCECEQCSLPWLGPECNTCELQVFTNVSGCSPQNPCGAHGTLDAENCRCQCSEGWAGDRCEKCVRECPHGTLDPHTCSCSCDVHWTGVNCTTCSLQCQNGGTVDTHNCVCNCDSMHSGTYCQGGPCHMQISCDGCLSVSDGCEWCAQTASCAKKPMLDQVTRCVGPVRTGLCPTYGDCRKCEYTPAELLWLSKNGDPTLGFSHGSPVMPDVASAAPANSAPHECARDLGMTWCEAKGICVQDWEGGVNGPCILKPHLSEHKAHSNGFIESD